VVTPEVFQDNKKEEFWDVFFCLGALPIIWFNLISHFQIIDYIINNVHTYNYSIIHNLAIRFIQYMHMLMGTLDYIPVGAQFSFWLMPILFIITLLILF
jgi:hypothetical protein